MGANPSTDLEGAPEAQYCARHPNVETYLLCGRCGTPICPRCLVQTPVGARCRECANVRRLPTFNISGAFLARGLAAALVTGGVVGAFWGLAFSGGLGVFFLIFIGLGIGWAVSEAVSAATNHKRGPPLQAAAIAGVVVALLVRNVLLADALLIQNDIWAYIAAGIAAIFASSRLSGY